MSNHALEWAVKGGFIMAAASSIYFILFGGLLGMSGIAGSLAKYPMSILEIMKDIQLNLRQLSCLA
jgi:hypothetical protein